MKKCKKIVHVMHADKFTEPFISFIEENFNFAAHHFIVSVDDKYPIKSRKNMTQMILQRGFLKEMGVSLKNLYGADKIILHGLFVRRVVYMLFLQPWLLKKCYWVMWGGDLYYYLNRPHDSESNRYERIRSVVIRKIGHFVTYIKGDYELAKKWYGINGQYHECIMYPSNLYVDYDLPAKMESTINGKSIKILVGNSADPSNNHFEIFSMISSLEGEDFLIYCPLSYGSVAYAEEVAQKGKELFGDKFVPLLELMPLKQYMELLSEIHIAVFNHRRQQAMGNIITLLGMGKKVYMRDDITSWDTLVALGFRVFANNSISLTKMSDEDALENKRLAKESFSKKTLIEQWRSLLA